MTIEPVLQGVDIKYPEEQQVRERGFWEQIPLGASQGFRETTFSYLEDITRLAEARAGLQRNISKEEYDNHINRVPGVAYQPYMTEELLARINESYYAHAKYEDEWNKSGKMGAAGLIVGQIGGSIPDPINLIPLPGLASGNLLTRMAKAGAANVGAEFVLTPLAKEAYVARGTEYTDEMMLTNMAFAAAAGAGFTALVEGSTMGLVKAARAMGFNHAEPTLADRVVARYNQAYNTDIKLDKTTIELINRGEITLDLTNPNNISRKNVIIPGKSSYIDNTGRIFDDINATKNRDFIEVTPTAEKEIRISGNDRMITKLGRKILDRDTQAVDENTIYRLLIDGGPAEGLVLNDAQFKTWISDQIKLYNKGTIGQDIRQFKVGNAMKKLFGTDANEFIASPDPDFVFRNREGTYELHLDPVTKSFDANTMDGKIYQRIKGGLLEISDPDERIRVFKDVFESKLNASNTPGPLYKKPVRPATKTEPQILSEKTTDSVPARAQTLKLLNTVNKDNIGQKLETPTQKRINETDPAFLINEITAEKVNKILDRVNSTLPIDRKVTLEDLNVKITDGKIDYSSGAIFKNKIRLNLDNLILQDLDRRFSKLKNDSDIIRERKAVHDAEKNLNKCLKDNNQLNLL